MNYKETNIQQEHQEDTETTPKAIVSELHQEARKKLEVIQTLLEPCDRNTYGHKLREGAMKLGISVRSLQRLFKRYQQEGLTALVTIDRRDKGKHRIDDFWQEFIIKTYQEGNKGSKRMNVKQVAIRVQAKAYELKETDYPSYRTVLRVLKPYTDKKNKSIRSPGWQGNSLSVKTRDGFDLDISYSNQVWQCDHTRADILLVDRHGELKDNKLPLCLWFILCLLLNVVPKIFSEKLLRLCGIERLRVRYPILDQERWMF